MILIPCVIFGPFKLKASKGRGESLMTIANWQVRKMKNARINQIFYQEICIKMMWSLFIGSPSIFFFN
jgi:hypothetical protein